MDHKKAHDLEAFCATCPSAQEVAGVLHHLGFALTFHMDVDVSPEYEQLPPLPAQYHYRDEHGNEVIYLAGHDADFDGEPLPVHASRFWIYPGADTAAYRRVAHVLAAKWALAWRSESQARRHVA